MATQGGLIDIEKTAAKVVTTLVTAYGGVPFPEEVSEATKVVLEREFSRYNTAYIDLHKLHESNKSEYDGLKASTDKEINDLNKKLDAQEAHCNDRVKNATIGLKKQINDISNRADSERAEREKEKFELEEKKTKWKAEIEMYKKQTRHAREDRDSAFTSLEEEKEAKKILQERFESLQRRNDENLNEIKGWISEVNNVTEQREAVEKKLESCQAQLSPINERNRELEQGVEQLKFQLRVIAQALDQSEGALATCKIELADSREELNKYKPSTPFGSSTSSSPVKGGSLRDQIGDGNQSTPSPVSSIKSLVPSTKSPGSTKSSPVKTMELNRERERYKKLEATIQTDYVPLAVHEKAISDKIKELDNAKLEKDNVQQAEETCQTALKKLKDELTEKENDGKKDEATIKDLRAKIKELEEKVIRLEVDSNGVKREIVKYKQRIQEQEKQLNLDKNKIIKLEQRELQQQTMIKTEKEKTERKEKEVKRLSDELERTQTQLAAARKDADETDTELQKVRGKLAKREEEYKSLEKEIGEAETERDKFERDNEELKAHINQYELAAEKNKESLNDMVQKQKRSLQDSGNQFAAVQLENKKHRDDIKRLKKELNKAILESNDHVRVKTDAQRLVVNLEKKIRQLDKEAKQHTDEISRLRSQNERLGEVRDKLQGDVTRLTTDINRVNKEIVRLEEEKAVSADIESKRVADLQLERDRLKVENSSTAAEQARLEGEIKTHSEERSKLQTKIQSLETTAAAAAAATVTATARNNPGGDDPRLTDCEREREKLRDENRALELKIAGLEDDIKTINAERKALRDELAKQDTVINSNGQQAAQTQSTLDEQIAILTASQRDLNASIERMGQQTVSQGLSAADTSRALQAARGEIERLQNMAQALTVERDLLQDEVRLCVEAQTQYRQRARENAGAAPPPGPPGPGHGAPGVGPTDGGGATAADGHHNGLDLLSRTVSVVCKAVPYTTVWSILSAMFVMMVAVIIAEGRLYAEWKAANAHTRALYMSMNDRPTLCIGIPELEYFWHTVIVALTGGWRFGS